MGWLDAVAPVGAVVLVVAVAVRVGSSSIRRCLTVLPEPTPDAAELDGDLEADRARYFGKPWDVPALDDAVQVPTPAGRPCGMCGEAIQDGDRGWIRTALRTVDGRIIAELAAHHAECEALDIVGHVFGVCDCYGFDTSHASALELWSRIGQQQELDCG